MSETPSYPALIELASRLEGKDKKTVETALYCLNRMDAKELKLFNEVQSLREENERLEDTRIEFIAMINNLIDERVKMRKALNPFAANAKNFKDDCKDTLVVKIGVDVGYLRAAAAALRESGDE